MTRGEGVGGEGWKEEEATSQETCMRDTGTWTTGWGLTVGNGVAWTVESNKGNTGTTIIEQQ